MNKCFSNLFNKQRSIGNLHLNVSFRIIVIAFQSIHLVLSLLQRFVSTFLKSSSIRNNSWRALDSLLQSILFNKSFDFFLILFLVFRFLLFHLLSSLFNISFMLSSSGRHRGIQIFISITFFVHWSLWLHGWIDDLVLHVHMSSQISRGLWLMEVERFGLSDFNFFLFHLKLGHEFFLKLAEVRYRSCPRWLETEFLLALVNFFSGCTIDHLFF
mmetsp:Transcript_94911/g.130608  ORF Transcript_94911/g.130608 Transcript_94911/m.130608 type:complete len:214 (-) Transcript_94911:520-1161(-)